jgi:hypothetical protein
LAVLLAVGHAFGGSTWLARLEFAGWPLAIGYLVAASGIGDTTEVAAVK